MWHLDKHLMTVKDGEPRLPRNEVDVFKSRLKRMFPNLADAASERLAEIVRHAAPAQHGTTIIISTDARGESGRLAKNNGIEPFLPSKTTIAGATSIDGAIMIDLEGKCHGIGLILTVKPATTKTRLAVLDTTRSFAICEIKKTAWASLSR